MNTLNSQESKRFFRRSIICAVAIVIFFLILCFRLVYLQMIKNGFYATLSDRNVINIVPVQSNRGTIYDRNGAVLAKNTPVYSLMVVPGHIRDLSKTIRSLKKIIHLKKQDIDNFHHLMKQSYPYQAIPLKQSLTEAEVDNFYVKQYRYPGVSVQTNLIRNYPLGEATSDVVGYVGRINTAELSQVNPSNYTASDEIGKAGVEAEYESLLHGTTGASVAETDANGKIVRVLKTTKPAPGSNLYLTIDSKLQVYAKQLLGKNTGAVVAIQPATGQVLALVSNPTYDPNLFVKGMTTAQYHTLINNPQHPMFDRATRALYAPGSTVKPFIAFGALSDGVIDTQDYIFDPGWFRLPNTKHIFHNWVKKGFGWVNITRAITVSCDTFFYQLAATLGIDRLDQALTQFGFGNLTGINLPSEVAGVVPSPDWKMKHIGEPWYGGDTVVAGIGQGYILVTPIQLAAATATMAEHGLRFQPTVLLKLEQPDGTETVMQPISQPSINSKTPHAFSTVIQAMQNVISNPEGTAFPSFQNLAYTAAGKTGTAQVAADNANGTVSQTGMRFQNNHLFICFAPVNNPRIAIAVVVEHIHNMSQAGVQIGRKLLDFYMNELKQQQEANANSQTISLALPQPAAAATTTTVSSPPITQDITEEVQQEKNSVRKNKSTQLQQQMDMKMDAQMDMQTQTGIAKNANTKTQ